MCLWKCLSIWKHIWTHTHYIYSCLARTSAIGNQLPHVSAYKIMVPFSYRKYFRLAVLNLRKEWWNGFSLFEGKISSVVTLQIKRTRSYLESSIWFLKKHRRISGRLNSRWELLHVRLFHFMLVVACMCYTFYVLDTCKYNFM